MFGYSERSFDWLESYHERARQSTLNGMRSTLKVLKITLGVALIILGLLALVTPLTPGSWLALIGLELVGGGFLIPKPVRQKMKEWGERIQKKWRRRHR